LKVTLLINEPGKGRELTMVMNQDEAEKRICPLSMADGGHNCRASACHGWRWLPKQHDARTAVGFCAMAA
jgi:hypothetical protein